MFPLRHQRARNWNLSFEPCIVIQLYWHILRDNAVMCNKSLSYEHLFVCLCNMVTAARLEPSLLLLRPLRSHPSQSFPSPQTMFGINVERCWWRHCKLLVRDNVIYKYFALRLWSEFILLTKTIIMTVDLQRKKEKCFGIQIHVSRSKNVKRVKVKV